MNTHTVVMTICIIFGKLKQDQIPTWIGQVGRKSHLWPRRFWQYVVAGKGRVNFL